MYLINSLCKNIVKFILNIYIDTAIYLINSKGKRIIELVKILIILLAMLYIDLILSAITF